MNNVDRDIQRKLRALRHAEQEFYLSLLKSPSGRGTGLPRKTPADDS
jgi:hypothetical protein